MTGFTLQVSLTDNEIAAVKSPKPANAADFVTATDKAIKALEDAVYFQTEKEPANG